MPANVESMFYYGEAPWHGLGRKLDNPATAEEAIVAAGLDWEVELRELCFLSRSRFPFQPIGISIHKAVTRIDPQGDIFLGIVGSRYRPIQNREAFSFFDSVVGRGQAIYHTAGSLGKGERIWILAKLPGEVRILKTDDTVEKFLLLSNSHDGSSTLRIFFTPIRVVCENTLMAAFSGAKSEGISIMHTKNYEKKVAEAQRVLGLGIRYYDDFQNVANELGKKMINQRTLDEYLKTLIPDNPQAKSNIRTKNIRNSIAYLFEAGRGMDMPGIRGTAWMAVNAVTEYVDYFRKVRGEKAVATSNRLNSVWFGSGAELKRKAWEEAVKLLN